MILLKLIESLEYAKKLGFKINSQTKLFSDISQIINHIKQVTELRNQLDYEIDGMVIKVNEYVIQENSVILLE